jgi:hypothetical protein
MYNFWTASIQITLGLVQGLGVSQFNFQYLKTKTGYDFWLIKRKEKGDPKIPNFI